MRLQRLGLAGRDLAFCIAVASFLKVAVPAAVIHHLDRLDDARRDLLAMPHFCRLPRNTRSHKFTSVEAALHELHYQVHEFQDIFKFSPSQVKVLGTLLLPDGFETPGHGRLGTEEAMLMLLAALRHRYRNKNALGRTLDRDPDNLWRHVNRMVDMLDEKFRSLFDVRMLPIHAHGHLESWKSAVKTLFSQKFPAMQFPQYLDGVCFILDGMRQDLTRSGFFGVEESTYSAYTGQNDLVWGVLLSAQGMIVALIGPFTGRHNDITFITPVLAEKVLQIGGKVLADSIFPKRDWLVPLPTRADQENMGIADNQVAASSALRMPVEWEIGAVQSAFPLPFDGALNKVLQSNVTARMRVSFLL